MTYKPMSFGQRVRSVFRLFLLLTFLVAVALIAAITTIRLTIHGRQQTMPDLVGVPLEKAKTTAGRAGLDLVIQDKVFSPQYAAGQIVSQIPPPQTRIKAGQRAHVLVSLGRPQAQIPNMVGASLRAARIMVLQGGLTMGNVATLPWSGTEANQVVAQDPPPGSEAHSPAVNFLVSGGGKPPDDFLCPNFIGRSLPEVRRALDRAGFGVGQVTPIPTTAAARDTILNQSPPPGSKISPGTKLDFQYVQ